MTDRYIVILVDNSDTANKINLEASDTKFGSTKVEAFSTRTQMVGLRHRATRPTLIVDMIKDRSHPDFDDWYENCVIPSAVKATLIKEDAIKRKG